MVAEESENMSADSPSRQVTVVDVYDLASAIGKDFERLIDQFGSDVVTNLMPKVSGCFFWTRKFYKGCKFQVISALELLEAFASRNDRENEEIAGLKTTVQRLEEDKEQRMECRKKFDRVCALFLTFAERFEDFRFFSGTWADRRELQKRNQAAMGYGTAITRRE